MLNILKYDPKNKFKKEVLKILVNKQMSDKEIAKLSDLFKTMDQDGSGELDYQEMMQAMQKCGIEVDEKEYY